jgi:hypothetical protein
MTTMKIRRIVSLLAVSLLASVGLAVTASPAQADFSWCPAGKWCIATDVNGNGNKWSYWVSAQDGGVEMASSQRSQISSVWNRTATTETLTDNLTCTGNKVGIPAGIATNLSDVGTAAHTSWDNIARSFYSSGTTQPPPGGPCNHQNG